MHKIKSNAIYIVLIIMIAAAFVLVVRSSGECGDTCSVEIQYGPEGFADISANEAFALIQNNSENPDFVILDIRRPEEFESGYIEGSINIDFYSDAFEDDLDELDKELTYLIYCRTARRTGETMKIMEGLKFTSVYNMSGGINGWIDDGFPVTIPQKG